MIIRLFKNSSSAIGAVNYVLSNKDHAGNPRSVEPKILDGDAFLTKEVDTLYCSKFQHKSVSGVIAFAGNEDLDEKQKHKLIEDFKKTFLGNMKDRVNALFVEHRDKGNLEIHFVINRVDLTTKKAFNPFPPGQMAQDFKDSFTALKNHEFGFKQIVENPLKTKFSSDELKALANKRHSFTQLETKIKISKAIKDIVKQSLVKNKAELVDYLKNEIGLNVHRNGDNYISIKTADFNIRLKDGIYSNHDGKAYEEVKAEYKEALASHLNVEKTQATFNRILQSRNAYNTKKYKTEEQQDLINFKPSLKAPEMPIGASFQTSPALYTHTEDSSSMPSPGSVPGIPTQAQMPIGKESSSEDSPQGSSSNDFGGGGRDSSVILAEASLNEALGELGRATTPQERAKALQRVTLARIAYDKVVAQSHKNKQNQKLTK